MKMAHISLPMIAITAALSFSQGASAASPDKKNPVSGEEIISIYNGKTWMWSKGGSFWGGGGKFEAYWKEESVAIGKWYATTKGSLCYEAIWKSDASKDGTEVKRCWRNVKDSTGALWQIGEDDDEWYRLTQEKIDALKSGNKIKSEVRKRRKQAGL